MKRKASAALIIIIILVVAAIAASVYFVAKPEKAKPVEVKTAIDIIPADAEMCLVINNMDMALGGLDQYLAGISPVPAAISMAARMPLAGITGDPALANINTQGQFAAFALAEPSQAGPNSNTPFGNIYVFFVVPTKDFNTLIKDNASYSAPDAKGIYTITAKIFGSNQIELLCKNINNHLVLTGTSSPAKEKAYEKLITIGTNERLKDSLNAAQLVDSNDKPFWANIDIENVNKKFGPKIIEQLNSTKPMFADMPNQSGIEVAKVMDMYFEFIKQMLQETDSLSVSLDAKPDMLRINKYIKPLAGSDTQSALAGSSTSTLDTKSLAYLKANAAMNFVCNIKDPLIKNIQIASLEFFQMLNPTLTDEQMAEMIAYAEESFAAMGSTALGTFTISDDPNQGLPINGLYLVEISDKDKFNGLMKKSETMWDDYDLGKLYESFGMNMDFTIFKAVDTHKNISVDKALLSFASSEPNSPAGKMLDDMYGDGILYHWAVVDDKMICGLGSDSAQIVKDGIDEFSSEKQLTVAPDVQAAMDSIENVNTADMFGTYNYVQILKWYLPLMLKQMNTEADLSNMTFQSDSSIAFAVWAQDDSIEFEIALPKQHLTDAIKAFEPLIQAQQQMMQQHNAPAPIN